MSEGSRVRGGAQCQAKAVLLNHPLTRRAETYFAVFGTGVPLLIMCGLEADGAALQGATGLSDWEEEGGFAALVRVTCFHFG